MENDQEKPTVSSPTCTALLCVVSPHEKGFWQADIYFDGWSEGSAPDYFFTGKSGEARNDIIEKVKQTYPLASVVDGITGICTDCAEEHFNLESECAHCGGIIGDT
jgi:hypothetical protein